MWAVPAYAHGFPGQSVRALPTLPRDSMLPRFTGEHMVVVDAVPVSMGMVLEDVVVVDVAVPILAIDSFPLVDLSAVRGTMAAV